MAVLRNELFPSCDRRPRGAGACPSGASSVCAGLARVFGRGLAGIFLCALALGGSVAWAEGQASREYQLKAVFLFNFAQFVDWPQDAFASTNSPLVIGVIGNDPFGQVLDATVAGETAHERRLVVERYRTVEEIRNCHILFISQSEGRHLEKIVASMRAKPVLTVSDIEGATARGVILQFLTENNKIRFRINLEAAEAARLTISSKLLRVAELVRSGRNP